MEGKGLQQVEINSFDLHYEDYRMKNKVDEGALCASIAEHGIREPLQGVDTKESSPSQGGLSGLGGKDGRKILLNGFKRYRCAKKMGIMIVPYSSLGNDETFGIIQLIRIANSKSLTILEQAKLIEELRSVQKLCVGEIARLLEKSKSWVSMRVGLTKEISKEVMEKLFKGEFPVYSYMYTMRQFMRMNRISKKEIDEFVRLTAGKSLSVREIERLAHGYFQGSEEFREQLRNGNLSWIMRRRPKNNQNPEALNETERTAIRELDLVLKYMQRVIRVLPDTRIGKGGEFYAQANILSGGIIREMATFTKTIKELYDRSGEM